MTKNIKNLIFLICISTSYAEISAPLIISKDQTLAPIAINDNKLYLIDTKANLQIISDINIPNIIKNLARDNAESLTSTKSPIKKYKATRKGNNQKGYVFVSGSKVSILNGLDPNKRMDKRLNINVTDRLDVLGLHEVTYSIYRKNIRTTKEFKYPSNILTLSLPDKSILNDINNGMMFRNFGPFVPTEGKWIKEKYYSISHPQANMEIISITSNGNSGFSSIKDITYIPVQNNNTIELYNNSDIQKYNVFTGIGKREHSIVNDELSIKSLEPSNDQKISIRGAVPPNAYTITVKITYKGGDLIIGKSVEDAKNYKINKKLDKEGYNEVTYSYIDGKVVESQDKMLQLSIPPKKTITIKHLSIVATKALN